MRRLLTTLLAAVVITMMLGSPVSAGEWKTIRFATEGAYPPFNMLDSNGQLQGFDVDITNALCKQMGVECKLMIQDWDGLIPGLLAKKYDAIVASMSITEERKQKVDFTNKYYVSPARFVAKKGAGIDVSKKGLKGKVVGVQRATIHENFVRDNFGDSIQIKSYATQDEANMDLTAGRVDLVIADATVLQGGFLDTDAGKGYAFIGPSFTDAKWFGEGIGIAVRKGDGDLKEKLNKAIKDLRKSGVYQKINAKYFDFDLYGE
ncbi:lysine arginine ornithine ABC transporter, periplasmic binding protein [Desulfosarcina variabilis str. Montpellier]|uniref:ABC transporter substrate-binding protein n=1 Tax=Desulfosarcina variabilis TaxID=2300 RepID=UPI003AFB1DA0